MLTVKTDADFNFYTDGLLDGGACVVAIRVNLTFLDVNTPVSSAQIFNRINTFI